MTTYQSSCNLMACTTFEGVVRMFVSDRNRKVLEEYRAIVDKDPDYLTYHFMSTALKLQYQLKLNESSSLKIGGCMQEGVGRCCVVDALKEAIDRTSPIHTIVEKSEQWPA